MVPTIQGVQTPLQHIDSHVALCSKDNYRIMEEGCSRHAALLLCQILQIEVSPEEVGTRQSRFVHFVAHRA
jgi:hypothetical protein